MTNQKESNNFISAKKFEFEIVQSEIERLYLDLNRSLYNMFKMIEDEYEKNEFFNPDKDIIMPNENITEFERHQNLAKGLCNYVYHNSLILVSYSIFEYSLKLICDFIIDHIKPPSDFFIPSNDILSKCVKFIKSLDLVDISGRIEEIYNQLTKVNKLRNLVAHHNGNIIKNRNKQIICQDNYKLLKQDRRIIIFDNGQIYINNSEYIKEFVSISQDFLNHIMTSLESKSPLTQVNGNFGTVLSMPRNQT